MELKIEYTSEFTPVYENQVYSRTGVVTLEEEKLQLQGILTLRRYTEPHEDQVVEYLRNKARELSGAAQLILPNTARQVNGLEDLIKNLPDKAIADISLGDKNCIEFIRSKTPSVTLLPGENPKKYMSARFGIIPEGIIESNRENINSSSWYDKALSHDELNERGFGELWRLQILYEGSLPLREEIDTLLKHKTQTSETLQINRRYAIGDITPLVNFIYSNYNDAEKMQLITDHSQGALEEASMIPLIELHKLIYARIAKAEAMDNERKQQSAIKKGLTL